MAGRIIDKWRTYKYGRITGADLEQLIGVFEELWSERESYASVKDDPEQWGRSLGQLAALPNWITLYEISLVQLIATLVQQTGVGEQFVAAAQDGVQGLMQFVEQLPEKPPSMETALPAALAMIGNLEAISLYSRTINDMVRAAKDGEIGALIEAVSVDAYVLSFPFFLAGMRLDQFSGDSSFTREIMRAISGPHKRRYAYVKLRWAEYLLRDQGAFEACSREEIYLLLVHHLKLYDAAGEQDDAKSALFAMFKKWQKQAGIQNPRFGFSVKKKA